LTRVLSWSVSQPDNDAMSHNSPQAGSSSRQRGQDSVDRMAMSQRFFE